MGHKERLELVLDCEEPTRLARFWREALDYRDHYTDVNLALQALGARRVDGGVQR